MGRKSRAKRNKRERITRVKPVAPDDHFQYGPIELARFGKMVLLRSHMSDEQFEKVQDMLVQRFPELCHQIDEDVLSIANIVRRLPCQELLKRAYWEMALHRINVESEVEIDQEGVASLRMVDYLQSVVAAVEPSKSIQPDVTEEDWQQLAKLVGDLFSQLNTNYQICRSAHARRTDPNYDRDFDEYYVKAQLYWCNIRGDRYLVHQLPFFRSVLSPHDDILLELFGVNSEGLLNAIQKLQDSLTFGLDKLKEDLRQFQKTTTQEIAKRIEGIESLSKDDLQGIMSQVIEDNAWGEWRDDVTGRLLGLDLFDVYKITNLPRALLDELSWSAGEESDFFAEGGYKGWPLRIWPIFKRPFLKIKDGYYCFDLFTFFDNFYRAVQRLLLSKKPEYLPEWNRKQKELSEQMPCTLFARLLPGAQIYRSVYYRWFSGNGGPKQWCEADALVIFEDHLFIMEVKAGAFTYTAPATDFPAYIESMKNLIMKPAQQGRRFLEYLQSDAEITLFDSDHKPITKISKSRFEHITVCAVTLDPFTELASRVEHLKKIGIDVGQHPIWSISISDLMVYADVFQNPLIFLHYVQQRMLAFKTKLIEVEDELDHLGLYLKHNAYSQYAQELGANGHLRWNGYRSAIDGFFSKKLYNPGSESLLRQEMPSRLREIVDRLSLINQIGRRKVSSLLLDCSGEWRGLITSGIDDILQEQFVTGRAKPRSTHGDIKITLFCWQKGVLQRDQKLARDHTRAAMLITNDTDRLLLELFFDERGDLVDVQYEFFNIDQIPEIELPELRARAEALRVRRLNTAKEINGKIGRNAQCPCGSGKKYKKCCLMS